MILSEVLLNLQTNMKKHFLFFLGLLSIFALSFDVVVAQEGALNDVKVTVQKLVNIAETMAGEPAREARRTKLREIMIERFDFAEMAKRSLGAEWSKIKPEEQAEWQLKLPARAHIGVAGIAARADGGTQLRLSSHLLESGRTKGSRRCLR